MLGCSNSQINQITGPSMSNESEVLEVPAGSVIDYGENILWGYYGIEIASDGSYADIIPNRSINWRWGIHLNALKFLESDPCTTCVSTSNVQKLPNGDVSVDVSITHPFKDPAFTGFDVRGIIMFPGSQVIPDEKLRELAGLPPLVTGLKARWATHLKGDAELMNTDGYTSAFSPDEMHDSWITEDPWELGIDDLPIFGYYPGIFASGQNISTIHGYKHFWSNEIRHMFEVNKTVTRTYIIRPPSAGPIEASYAVYAHWFEPDVVPVVNPAEDFPPQANSPLPYEFWVTQDEPIDPDKDGFEQSSHLHWHIKTWQQFNLKYWLGSQMDVMYKNTLGADFMHQSTGDPDDYRATDFETTGYEKIPGGLPGKWPYLLSFEVHDPDGKFAPPIAVEKFIFYIDIAESDGE